jgi:Na+/H+ antiporter NhaD/arsenite permease-like protein
MAELLAAAIFGIGYVAISMEHRVLLNKAATSLLLAVVLWVIAGLVLPAEAVQLALVEAGADIFGLVIFLLAAMTLVEILVHYHLFDVLERFLRNRGWGTYQMGWAMVVMAFVFSAFIDNLTTTIVIIQIARRLFAKEDLLTIGALIVIVANAGGAFSPIGDVTTLMLWFAQKFSATEVIVQGVLPSLAMMAVVGTLMLSRVKTSQQPLQEDCCPPFRLSRSDRGVLAVTLGSFLLPLVAVVMGLPPYFGLLAGLGVVWMVIDAAKRARPQKTHLGVNIQRFLQKTDIESLQFFIGILLAVGALHALGVLDAVTDSLLGQAPSWVRLVAAFTGLGVGSAIVDNVPLTAAAISALEGVSSSLWVLLALTVGMGGSLLVIGSAAGVIAMGMLPEMSFGRYLRVATVPALVGFAAAIGTWLLQVAII